MRRTGAVVLTLTMAAQPTLAQQVAPNPAPPPPPDTTRMTARELGLSVYPSQNQTPQQLATDEAACYDWAAQQVGYRVKPGNANAQAQAAGQAAAQQTAQATQGAAVAGAARGAVAGVAIGAIAGDAGTGAAIGAAAGAMAGRRARQQASQQAGQQAAAATTQQANDQVAAFKRAMSTCLTGRGYTVQ
jgi:hypothetical protein